MNSTSLKELLEVFVAKDCAPSEYPPELDSLLSDTAKNGVVKFSWQLLRPLVKFRLECVLKSEALSRNPEDDKDLPRMLSQRLDAFDNPPFTIQRVCELVMYPKQHYKSRAKYMRALEKNLMVVTTHQPDFTWMQNPRLTEEPSAIMNHTPNHTTPNSSEVRERAGLLNEQTSHLLQERDATAPLDHHPSSSTPPPHPSQTRDGTPPPLETHHVHHPYPSLVVGTSPHLQGQEASLNPASLLPHPQPQGHQRPQAEALPSPVQEVTMDHGVTPPLAGVSPSQEGGTVATPPSQDHLSHDTEVAQPSYDCRSSLGLVRKRSSSQRDGVEEGHGSADLMGLVLQEADSTTIDHTHSTVDHTHEGRTDPESIPTVRGAGVLEKPKVETIVEQDGVKKVRHIGMGEQGGVPTTDAGGEEEVLEGRGGGIVLRDGGAAAMAEAVEMAVQRKECYKEAATGQVELEAQGPNPLNSGTTEGR